MITIPKLSFIEQVHDIFTEKIEPLRAKSTKFA